VRGARRRRRLSGVRGRHRPAQFARHLVTLGWSGSRTPVPGSAHRSMAVVAKPGTAGSGAYDRAKHVGVHFPLGLHPVGSPLFRRLASALGMSPR
jgi:hypothetical protein